jgi:hypothetical protein
VSHAPTKDLIVDGDAALKAGWEIIAFTIVGIVVAGVSVLSNAQSAHQSIGEEA